MKRSSESRAWFDVLGLLTVLGGLALLVIGSLVNSRQAALSVPDWPRSYGKWILVGEWTGNVVLEHSHRLAAAAIGLLLVVYLVLRIRRPGTSGGLRSLAYAVGALYVLQVLMGGGIVLLLDPPWLAALHAVTALLVFGGLTLLVTLPWISESEASPRGEGLGRRQRRLATATAWLVLLQVLLGALSRHPGFQGQLIVAFLGHLAMGLTLVVLVPVTVVSVARRSSGRIRSGALVLLVLLVLQLVVAAPLFIIAPEPLAEEWPPPPHFPLLHASHVALAGSILAASWWLALALRREVSQERPERARRSS